MSAALYGEAILQPLPDLQLRSQDGTLLALPAKRWCGPVDIADQTVVARLDGPTLDIGCGPGRFVGGIAALGLPVLGIDIAPAAVALTRQRGGLALQADVFDHIPGTGRWSWALLMDGNIGIGGDPKRLLRRARELLSTRGHLLVEVEQPGGWTGRQQVRLELGERVGRWFPWAWVTQRDLQDIAADAGLRLTDAWNHQGRCFVELIPWSPDCNRSPLAATDTTV